MTLNAVSPAPLDRHNLSGLDRLQRDERIWDEHLQLRITTPGGDENDHGNIELRQILLERNSAIYRDQDIELSSNGCTQQFTVQYALQAYLFDRVNLVTMEIFSEAFGRAFVKQQFHIP